jgi:hypothetical protein
MSNVLALARRGGALAAATRRSSSQLALTCARCARTNTRARARLTRAHHPA